MIRPAIGGWIIDDHGGRGSGVAGVLVLDVAFGLDLERAVLDVEVAGQALVQPVEDGVGATAGRRLVGDDDVGGQHRDAAGDGPGVQVVDVDHAGDLDDVAAGVLRV